MKIDKITIRNLTAIEGEQIIDFTQEPLRSAGLFAITGDTGSGKSTILDAVCLALYNRAPRFEGVERFRKEDLEKNDGNAAPIQASDVRGILRRGCKEAGATVEFTTASGERYVAGWNMRVKRTGSYDKVVRSLSRLSPKRETFSEREVDLMIPQVIGLDYTQFTRTVMLAQNSFATFLRAKRDEKSALLEKLTGTEVYGQISQSIHAYAAAATKKVDSLNDIITGIMHDALQPEELSALSEERTLLTASSKTLAEREALVGRQLQWLDDFDLASKSVAEREVAYAEANKNYMAAKGDESELARYDSVLDVQSLYQEIVVRRKDIEAMKSRESAIATQIETEADHQKKAAAMLETAQDRVREAEEHFAQRRPAISRGHVLNGEISEVESQLKRAEEVLETTRNVLGERESLFKTKGDQLCKTRQDLEKHLLHKQALSVHKLMFDKFDLVKDKLTALTVETKRNEETHKKFVEMQKKQTAIKASSEKMEKALQDSNDRLATLKSELLIHKQSNQGYDSAKLQQDFADNRNRLLGLERAQALWQRISGGYDELEEKRSEVSRLASQIEQLKRDLERARHDLEVTEEVSKRQNVALTLSQSANIVQLRKQLKEGTACPVCGGTHHPYHKETERELGELLNNLEQEYNETMEALRSNQERFDNIRTELDKNEGRLSADRVNLAEREKRQVADVEEWKSCAGLDASFSDCSQAVDRESRRLMIGLLADNTRRAVTEAEKDLEAFNFHQGHINRLNEQIGALEAQMNDNHARIDDLRTQYQIARASTEDMERAMSLSDRSCGALYADLDGLVTLSGWFTEWKNNNEGFRFRLTSLYDDWQQTGKEADSLQRSEALLVEELKSVESSLAEVRVHLTQCVETRDMVRTALADKKMELAQLFGSDTPENEEAALQAESTQARQAEKVAREAYEKAAAQINLLHGEQQSLLQNRMSRQQENSARMSELDLWMSRYNATHSPMQFSELERIFSGSRDWKALRARLDALKEAVVLSENNLETARQTVVKLRSIPDCPSGGNEDTREALTGTA